MSAPPLFKWESPMGEKCILPLQMGPWHISCLPQMEWVFPSLLSFHKQSLFNSLSKVMIGPTLSAHKIFWKCFMFSYSVQSFPYILFIVGYYIDYVWLFEKLTCLTIHEITHFISQKHWKHGPKETDFCLYSWGYVSLSCANAETKIQVSVVPKLSMAWLTLLSCMLDIWNCMHPSN